MGNEPSFNHNQLLTAQNKTLSMIINHTSFKETITTIIQCMEEFIPRLHAVFLEDGQFEYNQSIHWNQIKKLKTLNIMSFQTSSKNMDLLSYSKQDSSFLLDYEGCLFFPTDSNNNRLMLFVFLQQDRSLSAYELDLIRYFCKLAAISFEQKQEKLLKDVYQLVENNISDLITIIDLRGNILYASTSHEHILGYNPIHLIGKTASGFLHPEDQEGIYQFLEEINLSNSTLLAECRLLKSDGSYMIVESKGVQVTTENDSENKIVIVSRDITSRKEAEETIKFMAYHDPLTGIPNRRSLKKKLEKLLEQSKEEQTIFSILFVDLDNFKMINDEYGHEMGDMVLINITERLKQHVSDHGFLARWGGDEFAIVIPSANENEAVSIANTIIDELGQSVEINGFLSSITPSIGISVFPRDGEDLQTLFEKADKAMYQAKDRGKNNVISYHI